MWCIVLEDIEIGGKFIKKGDKVVMWYVFGNWDEDEIENFDVFIIDWFDVCYYMVFGYGIY